MPLVSSHCRVLKNGDPHYLVLQTTSITKFYFLLYGILFLTFINTNVFYLLSFKFSRKLVKNMAFSFIHYCTLILINKKKKKRKKKREMCLKNKATHHCGCPHFSPSFDFFLTYFRFFWNTTNLVV